MTYVPLEQRLVAESGIASRVPGFAFAHLRAVERLEVRADPDDGHIVEIVFRLEGAAGIVAVLRIVDARGTLPEIDREISVGELFIEDLNRDQLEGVGYYVHDEGGPLSLYCRSVTLAVREA